ncbi:14278_t:CDS:2, partial [Gigaspora margarita]
ISGQANQFGSSISLLEISNDKRKKEWVLSEEGEAFKIKEKKEKTIQNKQEFKNLRSLESSEKELILQAELNEKLKEEILAILTRNLNRQKRKYYYYTDGSLQKDNRDKGNIAVMGAVVVQVDKKEEVSLEEISAYTTGWPLSTRAKLLVIWIATLLSLSKTEVVIKTDSAVSIMNIETSKYTATARQ